MSPLHLDTIGNLVLSVNVQFNVARKEAQKFEQFVASTQHLIKNLSMINFAIHPQDQRRCNINAMLSDVQRGLGDRSEM